MEIKPALEDGLLLNSSLILLTSSLANEDLELRPLVVLGGEEVLMLHKLIYLVGLEPGQVCLK